MLSKFQGRKPVGKRPATGYQEHGYKKGIDEQSLEEASMNEYVERDPINMDAPPSKSLSSAPPTLPPIPRVASQYGSYGPVSLSELERKLMSHGLDPQSPIERIEVSDDHVSTGQPQALQSPQNVLPGRTRQSTATRENNFSRPITQRGLEQIGLPKIQPRMYTAPMPPLPQQRSSSPPERHAWGYQEPPVPSDRDPQPISPSSQRPAVSLQAAREAPSRPPPPPPSQSDDLSAQRPLVQDFHRLRPKSAGAALSTSSNFSTQFPPPRSSGNTASNAQLVPDRPPPLPPLPHKVFAADTSSTMGRSSNTQSASSKSSKPMLNRFNPMSLLGRRRSNQPTPSMTNDNTSEKRNNLINGPPMPKDYDPRIRGSVVHDFSAPRPKRFTSTQDARSSRVQNFTIKVPDQDPLTIQGNLHEEHVSQQGKLNDVERQHTPIFKEHFGDEIDTWRYDESDRRNQNTTGIADRLPIDDTNEQKGSLPVFARKLPENLSLPLPIDNKAASQELPKVQSPPNLDERPLLPEMTPKKAVEDTPPPQITPEAKSRASSAGDMLTPASGLPKHLKSNASSRFSFDLAGVGSTVQEKLLEDKHRQKTAQRARASTTSDTSLVESDEGDFGYDDLDYDDGLEEPVPGVDDDEDEFSGMASVSNSALPPLSDITGQQSMSSGLGTSFGLSQPLMVFPDSSLASDSIPEIPFPNINPAVTEAAPRAPTYGYEDDDLYFDDGMIDEIDLQAGEQFDESVFDDENSRIYGLPLRDLQPLSAVPEVLSGDSSRQSTRPISMESGFVTGNNAKATTDTSRTSVQPPDSTQAPRKSSFAENGERDAKFDESAGLTKDNLAAYHNALAFAATRAAVEGRFDRRPSAGDDGTNQKPHLRVSFNERQLGANMQPLDDEGPGFRFDDDEELDDDAIIAAANAEALENDDEGFYGEEFGFYARSSGSGEADYVNGGYFGASGKNNIKRSHSGRDNGQEPSLTPITERSEWSQRNSMISLAMHGSSFTAPPQTPGLAQLADSIQHEDEDNMTLSALMKLRRGAWGDNAGSAPSSSGSHKAFQGYPLPPDRNSIGANPGHHGTSYSIGSNASSSIMPPPSDASGAASITNSLTRLDTQSVIMGPPQVVGVDSSPNRRNTGKGHSRNSSGADSISYVKEEDEDGAKRWVMEKRRTGESGQMELLGRQIVEGGMI